MEPDDCRTGYMPYPQNLPPSGDSIVRFSESLKKVMRDNADTLFSSHIAESLVMERIQALTLTLALTLILTLTLTLTLIQVARRVGRQSRSLAMENLKV